MTEDGVVECDASIMDGRTCAYGAVGAAPGTIILMNRICYLHCSNTKKMRLFFFGVDSTKGKNSN